MPGGCLPIHIACTWGASPEVIKVLLAADLSSARVKDELGNIPLHSACFSGASIQVIEALLKADSKSLLTRNHQGSRPLDISKRLRHDNRATVMDLLLNRKEELMKTHGRSRSSGLLSDMAREAEEMNQRYAFIVPRIARVVSNHLRREGAPAHARRPSFGFRAGDNLQDTVGVEVTYGQAEQLNWI
jgi:ankyrin repeat protein